MSIKIILQHAGSTHLAVGEAQSNETLATVIARLGLKADSSLHLFAEGFEHALSPDQPVGELVSGKSPAVVRLHRGRCQHILVSVTFNGAVESRKFNPVERVAVVHHWATHIAFRMTPRDAAEHVLEVAGSNDRPDPDQQIGALATDATCAVAFDLVPFKRVEG